MENTNGTVGIVSVSDEADVKVQAVDGGVEVVVDAPSAVAVYDVAGRKVAEAFVGDTHCFALPCGVYLVNDTKVVVR
jgi:hypothetical protein